MASLQDQLTKDLELDVAPIIEEIKAEGAGLQGLAKIIEEIVIPLVGAQKAAILKLAREVDELRAAVVEIRRDE